MARRSPWKYPKGVESDFRKRLEDRVETAKKLAGKVIGEFRTVYGNDVDARAERNDTRNDSLTSNINAVSKMIGDARLAYYGTYTPERDEELASQVAERTDKHNQQVIEERAKTVLGVESIPATVSRKAVEKWTKENVDLIQSVGSEYFEDLESEVIEALEDGKRVESLAEAVEERAGVAESRATLIARDQLGTLNSQVNGERQQALGIGRYRWVSSEDNRVRPSHQVFNGQTYTWAEGTIEGHPGEPIQCRCTADPVIEDLVRNDSFIRFQNKIISGRRQLRVRGARNDGRRVHDRPGRCRHHGRT